MVAAQNTDLQRVWRLVQELSAQLAANQQETERLRRHIELNPPHYLHTVPLLDDTLQSSPASSLSTSSPTSPPLSGQKSTRSGRVDEREWQSLRQAYAHLADENASLLLENEDLGRLCAEYELGLTRAMDQVRTHGHDITAATLALHRNYAAQLEAVARERDTSRDAAAEAHGNLVKLSTSVREALANHSDVEAETVIQALTIENEALRTRLADVERRLDGDAPADSADTS